MIERKVKFLGHARDRFFRSVLYNVLGVASITTPLSIDAIRGYNKAFDAAILQDDPAEAVTVLARELGIVSPLDMLFSPTAIGGIIHAMKEAQHVYRNGE